MGQMDYIKGNMKRRVYHLPFDGCTDVFEALDFSNCKDEEEILDFKTQNGVQEDDYCSPCSLPFWMNKSKSKSKSKSSPESETNTNIIYDHEKQGYQNNQKNFSFQEFPEEQKFIMKMMIRNNIPINSSSYELSFRYIIEEDNIPSCALSEEDSYYSTKRQRDSLAKGNINANTNTNKVPEMMKKDGTGSRGQFQRMNSEVFQLKMFIPGSFRLKSISKRQRRLSR